MAKILIVDDAAFMRMMLKDIFTKAGHEIVAEAGNGIRCGKTRCKGFYCKTISGRTCS